MVTPNRSSLTFLRKKRAMGTISSPEELVGMSFKWVEPSETSFDLACLPYINGLTEPLQRLLRNNGIRTVTRPQQNPTSGNSGHSATFKQMWSTRFPAMTVVAWSYIGQTGR